MLPQLGFTEILLLSVLALVVIGPKDLPLMARKIGRWMARMRGLAAEFRAGFDELARQAELDELRREVQALRNDRTLTEIDREIRTPMTPLPPPSPPAPVVSEQTSSAPPEGEAAAHGETPGAAETPPAKAASGGA